MVTTMITSSKKGLSPLIAAVLLIVVVVGIGAVVTGIVRNQITADKQTIERTSTDVECSTNVEIDVPTYLDDFRICLGSDYVNFTIENTGSMTVDEFQMKVFGDAGFAQNDTLISTGLEPGQTEANYIAYYDDTSVGTVEQVMIVPKKKVTGETNKVFCSEAQLKFVDISDC
jgi:FlaG/FlaF family flagellin (archaellin)